MQSNLPLLKDDFSQYNFGFKNETNIGIGIFQTLFWDSILVDGNLVWNFPGVGMGWNLLEWSVGRGRLLHLLHLEWIKFFLTSISKFSLVTFPLDLLLMRTLS